MADTNNQEDSGREVIQDSLSKTEELLEKNKSLITYVLGGLILIVAGYMFYNNQVAIPAEKAALDGLYEAQFEFGRDSTEVAEGLFEDALSEHGGTKAGNLANLYLAIQMMDKKQFDDAIGYLEDFSPKGEILPHFKKGLLGDCYLENDEWEKAVEYYKDAANGANSKVISPYFYKKAGILYEQNGQAEEAVVLYQKALDNFLLEAYTEFKTSRDEMKRLLARAEASLK